MNETIQTYARLRAHRRRNENLTIYHLAGLKEAEIEEIQRNYPGATVNVVSAMDVCPEAALKGDQVSRRLVEVMWSLVEKGQKVTQDNVGSVLGMSQSGVSQVSKKLLPGGFRQIKKILVWLFNSLDDNNKSNISQSQMGSLTKEENWFVNDWLPSLVGYLNRGEESPEEVAEVLEVAIRAYGQKILDFVAVDTIIGLISAFMGLMPWEFFEGLRLGLGPPE